MVDCEVLKHMIQHLSVFPYSTAFTLDGNIGISPGMVEALEEELRAREVH